MSRLLLEGSHLISEQIHVLGSLWARYKSIEE